MDAGRAGLMPDAVSMNGPKKTKGEQVGAATVRFELKLEPPTDDKFNEFSYVHLQKERESKVKCSVRPLCL